jgi:flagellar basal-body rod modification protein FlgD
MSVDTTSTVTSLNGVQIKATTATNGSAMGKDDFLKLLVGQLQHQDPMQPADDTQFIGQMAQFSQLEQETNTAQSTSQISDQLSRTGALGLIGRTVNYLDADENTQSGVVTQVNVDKDGKATLTVGTTGGIDAGAVTQVR